MEHKYKLAVIHLYGDDVESQESIIQSQRQNYRHLKLLYPDVYIEALFVVKDAENIEFEDYLEFDFWVNPWPAGLVAKLFAFDKILLLSDKTDVLQNIEALKPLLKSEKQFQYISPQNHHCSVDCSFDPELDQQIEYYSSSKGKDCIVSSKNQRMLLAPSLIQFIFEFRMAISKRFNSIQK
jgi:hypothetical protein